MENYIFFLPFVFLRTQDVERNIVSEVVGRNDLTHIDTRVLAANVLDDEIVARLTALRPSPIHLLYMHVYVFVRRECHRAQR